MNKSKVAIVISCVLEKVDMIVGAGWAALCILTMCVVSSEMDIYTDIIYVIFAALGIKLFLVGRKRKKMRLEFKKYVACLSSNPTGQLENLAAASGTSVDVVKKNIQYMLKKKFFSNAYLDEKNNCLVLASKAGRAVSVENNVSESKQQNVNYVTVHCPNCGGVNKVTAGKVGECDFCGSPIQG